MVVVAEPLAQPAFQMLALPANIGDEVVALNGVLDRERRCAGDRVRQIRVPVLEEAGAVAERGVDLLRQQHGADRLIAGAETLGDRHQVGRDTFLRACVQCAGASHAAHDFVEDQQDAVPVADLAHTLEVAGRWRRAALRGAADGFGDEGDHRLGAKRLDFCVEFGRQALTVGGERFAGAKVAIGVRRRDVVAWKQHRGELLAPERIAADRQRAERVAVIALPAADEVLALRLAHLDAVLPRHFERSLHRLRAARDVIDMCDPVRRMCDQMIGETFGNLGREERAVHVGKLAHLLDDRRIDRWMPVAEAGYGGAAAGVDIALARGIDDLDAFAADGHRQGVAAGDLAMQNAG